MLKRVWIPSPNYSSRGGTGVRLIVLHTAEGARTIESLGGYFQGNVSASSHTGADDKANTIGEYVKRDNKAWTQANANPYCVAIEMCGFASWSEAEWDKHPNMLANTAAWIAEEAAHYGIPITKLSASQAQSGGRGICQHADLGAAGGGHWDCGSGFPIDRVLDMARGGSAPTPPTEDEIVAIAMAQKEGGALVVIYEDDKGDLWQTWQKKGESSWSGGEPGKSTAGLSFFAPNPKK
jgi:N-acetylmuramoyl-L-alanine amidase